MTTTTTTKVTTVEEMTARKITALAKSKGYFKSGKAILVKCSACGKDGLVFKKGTSTINACTCGWRQLVTAVKPAGATKVASTKCKTDGCKVLLSKWEINSGITICVRCRGGVTGGIAPTNGQSSMGFAPPVVGKQVNM